MQNRPNLFKPAASQEISQNGDGQKLRGEADANGALHMQPDQRQQEGAGEGTAALHIAAAVPRSNPNVDPLIAYHQETARIMADGMTIANAPIHPANLAGATIQTIDGPQAIQFTALHNPMVVSSQAPDPSRGQTMPFQQLLQDPLPMQLPMSPAQFEAAARRIAWNTINPGGPQSNLGPHTQYTDRDDPAWRLWEERFQYYKNNGIGNNGKRERMVYTRPMPHAKRSLGQISPEEEAADRESCRVMNDFLVQKFERLKQYAMLPPQPIQ